MRWGMDAEAHRGGVAHPSCGARRTVRVVTRLKIAAAPAGSRKAACTTKKGSTYCASYLGCAGAWC
jgi:hypothetical protein